MKHKHFEGKKKNPIWQVTNLHFSNALFLTNGEKKKRYIQDMKLT